MRIHLKQEEIVAALKQYISDKGIDLSAKDVTITFTAGRKNTGLSADMQIEDGEIPGYGLNDGEDEIGDEMPTRPALAAVPANKADEVVKAAEEASAASDEPDAPQLDVEATEEAKTATKTVSLFG